MKYQKLLSIVLCLAFVFTLAQPVAHAYSANSFDMNNISRDGCHVVYTSNCSDYTFGIYINTDTGIGSFSIVFNDNQSYLFDYFFSRNPDSIDINSADFWDDIINECFSNYSNQDPIFLPTAITTTNHFDNGIAVASTDSVEDEFFSWLEEKYGTKAYTDKLIAHSSREGYLLMVYETLLYTVDMDNSYYVSAAMSVMGFALAFISASPTATLISALSLITGAYGVISAGSTIRQYCVSAYWNRSVKLQNSTESLSNHGKSSVYDAYVNTQDLPLWMKAVNSPSLLPYMTI